MEDPTKPPSAPPTTTRADSKNAAVKNFRSLVLQYLMSSAPNMFYQKDQIEQRIQELVPNCPTPRHPTYYWMIEDAITRLNEEGGLSSAESISNFILVKHGDLLPWSHATLLKHHLKNLCERGFLVVNDDGLYFLGKETNLPEREPEPEPMSASDLDPSLNYEYDSDSTSSSGESFSLIKEREMIKRLKNKTLRKKHRRKGKNVHCSTSRQSRKRDSAVGIELKQESVVDEGRIDEPRVEIRKWKRGRPRKNVTSGCSSNQIPVGKQRKNVNVAVAEEALIGQTKVVAGKQNQQNEDQEFRPQIEVYSVDSDDMANITNMEQSDEDSEDVDLIIDKVYEEFQAEDDTQSFTIEEYNKVIRPRTEEQHRVQVDKHFVDDISHVEPSTMVPDIVPEERNRELSMGRTGSLQRDALTEESGKGMNIAEANGIQNTIEATERKDDNQNEPNGTIDLVNSNCQAEPSKIAMDIALQEQERQGSIEKTKSLQTDARVGEKGMNTPHDVNDLSLDDQACLMDGVEFQERESDVIEVENYFKDGCEILENRDKQAITEQNEYEAQEFEVSMEKIESFQKHVHVEETAKNMNITEAYGVQELIEELEFENETGKDAIETEAIRVCDLNNEELKFEKANQNDSMEINERDEEIGINDQSVEDHACEVHDVELQEQECEKSRFSREIEEQSRWKDAWELFTEQDQQDITERYQPEKGNKELKILDERGRETRNKQFPSQKSQKDGANEGESQQSEEQKQELDEYEEIDASMEQKEKELMNQQLKEQRRDVGPSQIMREAGIDKSKSQQLEEQNQVIEMHEKYENLDQMRPPLEKENIYASREQEKNEGVNLHLNELKQDATKNMNIKEAYGVQDLVEELEFENESHNEPNETMDLANGDNQSEPSTLVVNVALEETELKVSMERNESIQKDMDNEEPGVYETATKECGKESETNEQSAGCQTCLTISVECRERDSDVIEEKTVKDGCELSEEQDEQGLTEQNQPEEEESEVIMEITDSSQDYAHVVETGKDANETEAIRVCDLSSKELKFEKSNQYEPMEINECDEEIECNVNEQSVEDQAYEVHNAELQEQECEDSRLSRETEEQNGWKDACELVAEQDQQPITERYQPNKVDEELQILDERCKQGRETGNEQFPSQKSQYDVVNECESQQSEEQKQDVEMLDEYENLGEVQCASEIENFDASIEQNERKVTNQQLKEQKGECLSQIMQENGVNKSKSQLEEQNQVIEMHETYENLDQVQPPLEKENIYASREQEKNEGVNQHLNELKQDAAKIGEGKGIAELMLEFEEYCVSEKMELESHCGEKTSSLEQQPDTSRAKKSLKLKALNAVQQVEKRQLRPRLNKARPIESEAKGSIFVPIPEKLTETSPHKKLRVTKWLKQGTRRSLRLQQSRSEN